MENFGEQFLHQKESKLHTTGPVEHERERQKGLGKKPSQKPKDKIADWLKIIERTHTGHRDDPRVLERIKNHYHKILIEPYQDKLAKAAARIEERAGRTLGVEVRYEGEQLDQGGEIALEDLKKSLDQWIDYLTNPKEPYPMWFRYYVFTNIIHLSDFDKDESRFPTRAKDTVRLFPEIDRGALAYVQDIIGVSDDEQKFNQLINAQKQTGTPDNLIITKEKSREFANKSFGEQYLEGIRQRGEITPELRAETRGEWVTYKQGDNPLELWKSLQNKGTAWCTKGLATATTQLNGGDFHVYYTLDKHGKPTIPRIAIRMQEGTIFETRGVADSDQNLEGNMTQIANEKMSELPGKEKYERISGCMKQMTELYERCFEENRKTGEKRYLNPQLNREDLTFLYEIDSTIEGFGYDRDPRILEIRNQRNPKEDMLTIFDCTSEQVATNETEITENTKAYLGPWNPTIYNKVKNFPNTQHLYESFPDKKIFTYKLETNPQIDSPEKAEEELKARGIYITDWGHDILQKTEWSGEGKTYNLVQFTVGQLGFPQGATTDQIYAKAKELGLDLCPAEVGPHLRLSYPGGDWKIIAMEQVTDRYGYPYVFFLYRDGDELVLDGYYAEPSDMWGDDGHFVFLARK